LKGLEQLLHHLDDVRHAFSESKDLAKIAFLISRAKADFVTAIEATLSGYLSIAFDSMRDVLPVVVVNPRRRAVVHVPPGHWPRPTRWRRALAYCADVIRPTPRSLPDAQT